MAHSKEDRRTDNGWYGVQGISRRLQPGGRGRIKAPKRWQSNHARVIQVTPRLCARVLVIHKAEHAEVINERAIG